MKIYRKKKLKFDNNLHLNANQNINSFESGREGDDDDFTKFGKLS